MYWLLTDFCFLKMDPVKARQIQSKNQQSKPLLMYLLSSTLQNITGNVRKLIVKCLCTLAEVFVYSWRKDKISSVLPSWKSEYPFSPCNFFLRYIRWGEMKEILAYCTIIHNSTILYSPVFPSCPLPLKWVQTVSCLKYLLKERI